MPNSMAIGRTVADIAILPEIPREYIFDSHYTGGPKNRTSLIHHAEATVKGKLKLISLEGSQQKQNLLLLIQPRWQLRRTYFFNHCNE